MKHFWRRLDLPTGVLLAALAALQIADVASTLIGFRLGAREASPAIIACAQWAGRYVASPETATIIGLVINKCWLFPAILWLWALKCWIAEQKWARSGFWPRIKPTNSTWFLRVSVAFYSILLANNVAVIATLGVRRICQ